MAELRLGDCIEIMREMLDDSIDAVVTDPPYELGFMGKSWDRSGIAYNVEMWAEALRVLKPGGHLLSFGGTRTYHRMACAIEDAGFEIRDQLQWLYGSGFPKNLDVSKAIDKAAGAEREVVGRKQFADGSSQRATARAGIYSDQKGQAFATAPATPDAARWQGWGTALKPANEPLCLARKPLSEATVAANVLRWNGCGALNIDGCRIGTDDGTRNRPPSKPSSTTFAQDKWPQDPENRKPFDANGDGRWPANVLLDEEAAAALDEQSGERVLGGQRKSLAGTVDANHGIYGKNTRREDGYGFTDTGGASRFFYCAKSSRSERNAGLEGMPEQEAATMTGDEFRNPAWENARSNKEMRAANHHPTVKPVALMRWLVRLVTPPGGIVLDPFMGSGTTGMACVMEGFGFLGIERDEAYYTIAERRIGQAQAQLSFAFPIAVVMPDV